MTHTYKVSGMTCANCEATVQKLLTSVPGVTKVNIDRGTGDTEISMHHHIPTSDLQNALQSHPKYQLVEKDVHMAVQSSTFEAEENKTWWQTYKPIILIFFYITAASTLVQFFNSSFNWMIWMHHFMAGFFLAFSFFKLLDLNGFADSYSTYDIVAKRWRGWAYVYAFIELGLGLAYLISFLPVVTYLVTFVVMSVSLVGVMQSVLNKRKIQCACLGAVFNLPMSTVTIVENTLMILMSGIMLVMAIS